MRRMILIIRIGDRVDAVLQGHLDIYQEIVDGFIVRGGLRRDGGDAGVLEIDPVHGNAQDHVMGEPAVTGDDPGIRRQLVAVRRRPQRNRTGPAQLDLPIGPPGAELGRTEYHDAPAGEVDPGDGIRLHRVVAADQLDEHAGLQDRPDAHLVPGLDPDRGIAVEVGKRPAQVHASGVVVIRHLAPRQQGSLDVGVLRRGDGDAAVGLMGGQRADGMDVYAVIRFVSAAGDHDGVPGPDVPAGLHRITGRVDGGAADEDLAGGLDGDVGVARLIIRDGGRQQLPLVAKGHAHHAAGEDITHHFYITGTHNLHVPACAGAEPVGGETAGGIHQHAQGAVVIHEDELVDADSLTGQKRGGRQ